MSGSSISGAHNVSIIAGSGGGTFPNPLWRRNALGTVPALNTVCRVASWNFTDFLSMFNAANNTEVAASLESYGNGMAIFESDSLGVNHSGGHTDADWDGQWGIQFEADAPVPYRIHPRSASRPGGVFYNPGGNPAANHAYSQNIANDLIRRFMTVGRSFCAGNFDPNCGELDALNPGTPGVTDSGSWEQSSPGVSAYPRVPGTWGDASSTWGNSPAAYDRNTGDVFQHNAAGFHQWVRATGAKGTWFTRNGTPRSTNSEIICDPIRQRVIAIGSTGGPTAPMYAKRSENFSTWRNLAISGVTGGLNNDYWSCCFDPWVNGGNGGIWLCNDITSRGAFRLMSFADLTADSAATVASVAFAGINPSTAYGWGNEGTTRYGAVRHIRNLKGITWRTAAAGGQHFVQTAA